jgi:nucleotide-binding universal stress UspA family protein
MISHILAPLDGSPLAEGALPHAAVVARAFSAKISLLCVLEAESQGGWLSADSAEWRLRKSEAVAYLQAFQSRFREQGLAVDNEIREGDPAERIVECARERKIDLIVISTHGTSGPQDTAFGGTAARVLAETESSILVVRTSAALTKGKPDLYDTYARIVVPLDGSLRAEWALCLAATLARACGSELLLVHVAVAPRQFRPERGPGSPHEDHLIEQILAANCRAAEAYLEEMKRKLSVPDLRVRTELLVTTQAPLALHDFTEREAADLLVLSAHGTSGPAKWPYGSVVSNLLSHGKVPILVFQDMGEGALHVDPLVRPTEPSIQGT